MDFSSVDLGGHDLAVMALVGSYNYNLDTADSDKDYKFFVFPTFEDLYYNRMYAHSQVGKDFDYTVHDIRKLSEFLWKGHLNFIEVCFSQDATCTNKQIEWALFDHPEYIANLNQVGLYKSTYGSAMAKIQNIHKGTESTKQLIKKYGYDTKEAHHALRGLYTLSRYFFTGSMESALWYNRHEAQYKILMSVKNGEYTESQFLQKVESWQNNNKDIAKHYLNREPCNERKQGLEIIIQEAIRGNLF